MEVQHEETIPRNYQAVDHTGLCPADHDRLYKHAGGRILSLFMEDANDHYRLCATLYSKRTTLTVSEIVEQVGHVYQLFASHAPPGEDFMSLKVRAMELNEILAPLEGVLPDTEYPYEFDAAEPGDATPEYTTVIDVEIASRISAIEDLVPQYQRDVDTVNTRGAALEHYRLLLNAAKTGIRALRQALDTPQSGLVHQ